MNLLVSATFKTRDAAQNVIRQLEEIGISHTQMSLVMADETRAREFARGDGDNTGEGAAAGAAAGGVFGAIVGSLATVSAVAIPGLNLVVAGSVLGAVAGFLTGAGTGGLVGALIGAGLSENDAAAYEEEIKSGSILLAVKAKDEAQRERVRDIMENADAYHLSALSMGDTGIPKEF